MPATVKAGHDLIGAVKNAALFARTDDTLPAIYGVDLSWDSDGVEVVATDRYMLSREHVESAEVTADGPGHLFIPREQVKQLTSVKISRTGRPASGERPRARKGSKITLDQVSGGGSPANVPPCNAVAAAQRLPGPPAGDSEGRQAQSHLSAFHGGAA